jgi:PII-like signaling protein
MIHVKRLEMVVDAPYSEHVTRILDHHGVEGWTLVRGASGSGERGERLGDEITGVSNNHLILSTCVPDKLDALVADLRQALERFGGICLVSDASSILH